MSTFRTNVIPKDVYDFGGSDVSHTNYFAQAETCKRIASWFDHSASFATGPDTVGARDVGYTVAQALGYPEYF